MKSNTRIGAIPKVMYTPNKDFFVSLARHLAQMLQSMVYLWDLEQHKFLFLSASPFYLHGKNAKHVMFVTGEDEGVYFYDEEDAANCRIVNAALYSLSPAQLEHSVFHLEKPSKNDAGSFLVWHRIKCVMYGEKGSPILLLGIASHAANKMPCKPMIYNDIENKWSMYDYLSSAWEEFVPPMLNDRERLMLHLSSQGYSLDDISRLMIKSINTVVYYRRCIYEKFNVNSIPAAIALATKYGII